MEIERTIENFDVKLLSRFRKENHLGIKVILSGESRCLRIININSLASPFHLFPIFAKTCLSDLLQCTSSNLEVCSVVSVIVVELLEQEGAPDVAELQILILQPVYFALGLQPVNQLLHHSSFGTQNVVFPEIRFVRENFSIHVSVTFLETVTD